MAIVNKTKSGYSTDKRYVSSVACDQSLAFLQALIKSSSSKNTLKQSNKCAIVNKCTIAQLLNVKLSAQKLRLI